MSRSITNRLKTLGVLAATGLATVMACSDGGGNGGTGPNPAISISLSPTGATVEQGGSTDVTGTITRSGGFTGTVTFTVEGAPTGVDGDVSNVQTSNNTTTATITISVGASVTPGVYNLTVRGSGSGVTSVTAAFQLIVPSPPSYDLTLDPSALMIVRGSTGQSAVTISRQNFTGAVTLSLGGAPSGVTGTFDPAAPTGTSSTLTVSVSASVAAGAYNLTVDGSATPGDESAALTLTVTEPPSYSLAVDPNALTIEQGSSDGTTVTITRTNFTEAVTLSLGNAPAGVTGTFDPDAPTGNTSTLTVAVDLSVAPGTYNLTVDGTASAGNESAPLTLTVTAAPPSYTMSLTPDALSIEQGGSGTSQVSLARTNFTDGVTLTLEGAPAGVTGTFDPTPAPGDASTLTIDVGAGVAPGTYPLTVRGTATGLEDRTATLTLTVGTFSISVDPNALTIQQGMSDQTTVTVTRTNFTGTVTFSLGGAPMGVTGTFDPASTTGTTSTLTIDVDGTVAAGVYNLTVIGSTSAGAANASSPAVDMEATLTLTVTETPDYSLAVEPTALTIEQGTSDQAAVTITRTNFTGAVTLSLGGTPTGVTGTFDPAAPTGNTSTLTVNVDAAVEPGTYTLSVDGSGSAGDRSTPLSLTVTAPADYSLALDPAAVTIEQGAADQIAVGITRTNFTDAVTLSLGGAPTGVTSTFNPASTTGVGSILTVNVDGTVPPGVYNLTVDGIASVGARSAPLTLTVVEPPSFALSVDPDSIEVQQGATGQSTVTITRTNFTGAVTLSLDNAPAGLTGAFAPAAPTGNTSTLTVTVGSSVATGTYDLKVNGTGDGLDADVDFKVTVTEVAGFSLSASPSGATVAPTSTAVSTISITRTGGFMESVTLAVSGMPPGMTATLNPTSTTGNSSTLDVTLSGVADGTYPLTITGDATGFPQATTTFTVTVVTGGGGMVTADFSTCDLDERPIWLAYQDGSGAWMQVMGMNDVYTFTLNFDKGGVAWVTQDAQGDRDVSVIYMTTAELGMGLFVVCEPPGIKTVNATVAGLDMGDLANLSLGSTAASTFIAANGPVQFENVPAGPQNLVGFKSDAGDASMNARMYINRGLDIADNGTVGTVDFMGANSFAPETKTVTVVGLGAGETYGGFHSFQSIGSCQEASLHSVNASAGSSFEVHGVGSANLLSTDIHNLTVTATPSAIPFDRSRSVIDNRNALSDFTITLPPEMADPTITSLGGSYLRLQSSVALASEYAAFALFGYSNTNSDRSVNISATSGWLGSSMAVLGLDDFSGVSGWMDSYAPALTDMAEWVMFGFGGSIFEDDCTVGTSATASRSGTFP